MNDLKERITAEIEAEYREMKSKSSTYGELEANIKRCCKDIAYVASDYLPAVKHTMQELFNKDTGNLPIR